MHTIVWLKSPNGRDIGSPMYRWEDNIKIDLTETGLEGADWIHLTRDRVLWWALVNTVMMLLVP
jgi:hypothetical protein